MTQPKIASIKPCKLVSSRLSFFDVFYDMMEAVNRTQSQGTGLREPLMIIAFWLSL